MQYTHIKVNISNSINFYQQSFYISIPCICQQHETPNRIKYKAFVALRHLIHSGPFACTFVREKLKQTQVMLTQNCTSNMAFESDVNVECHRWSYLIIFTPHKGYYEHGRSDKNNT